ncbi:MAG: hypothetical protein IKB34_00065 [Clostridia bacterium]|nr:hypothetical protein [Clostridia bacterium]
MKSGAEPQNELSPRLIEIVASPGKPIEAGDILFSYEYDGALMFEYADRPGVIEDFSMEGNVGFIKFRP